MITGEIRPGTVRESPIPYPNDGSWQIKIRAKAFCSSGDNTHHNNPSYDPSSSLALPEKQGWRPVGYGVPHRETSWSTSSFNSEKGNEVL